MRTPVIAVVAALAACGSEAADDKRQTIEYVTRNVLAPNCGIAGCHSTFKQEEGLVFDTVDAVRTVLRYDLTDPNGSRLIGIGGPDEQPLTAYLKGNNEEFAPRMPIDGPMPDADIELVLGWFAAGAPGAATEDFAICQGTSTLAERGPDDSFAFTDCRDIACPASMTGQCVDGACQCAK